LLKKKKKFLNTRTHANALKKIPLPTLQQQQHRKYQNKKTPNETKL